MNIDQIVVIGILIVIIMAVFVSVIELAVPMLKKIEFNTICRNYLLIAESENGLSNEMQQNFIKDLRDKGYEGILIQADLKDSVMRGKLSILNVEASFKIYKIVGLFNKVSETVIYRFNQGFIARKIVM